MKAHANDNQGGISPVLQWAVEYLDTTQPANYNMASLARFTQDCYAGNSTALPLAAVKDSLTAQILCVKALQAFENSRLVNYGSMTRENIETNLIEHFRPFLQSVIDKQFNVFREVMELPQPEFERLFHKKGPVMSSKNSGQPATREEVAVDMAEAYGWGLMKKIVSEYGNYRAGQINAKDDPKGLLTTVNAIVYSTFFRKIIGEMPKEAVQLIIKDSKAKSDVKLDDAMMLALFERGLHPKSEKVAGNTLLTFDRDLGKMNEQLKENKSIKKPFEKFISDANDKEVDKFLDQYLSNLYKLAEDYEKVKRPESHVTVNLREDLEQARVGVEFYQRTAGNKAGINRDIWKEGVKPKEGAAVPKKSVSDEPKSSVKVEVSERSTSASTMPKASQRSDSSGILRKLGTSVATLRADKAERDLEKMRAKTESKPEIASIREKAQAEQKFDEAKKAGTAGEVPADLFQGPKKGI